MNPSDLKVSSVFELPKRKVARKKSAVWAEFFAARKTGDLIEAATRTEAKLICYHARKNCFHPAMRPTETGWSVFLRRAQETPKIEPVKAPEVPVAQVPLIAPAAEAQSKVTRIDEICVLKYAERAYEAFWNGRHSEAAYQPWKVVNTLPGFGHFRQSWIRVGGYIAAMVQGGAK